VCLQSMEPLTLEELKSEKCPRISAEDLLELGDYLGNGSTRSPTRKPGNQKPMLLVIDVRSPDEYPCTLFLRLMQLTPFHQFITTAGFKCLYGACKMSPSTTSLCSHIFLSSGIIVCMLFIFENNALGGNIGVASFISIDGQFQ